MTLKKPKPATVDEIRALVGKIDDDAVLAIWKTEATQDQIMQALASANGGYWNTLAQTGNREHMLNVRLVQDILAEYGLETQKD